MKYFQAISAFILTFFFSCKPIGQAIEPGQEVCKGPPALFEGTVTAPAKGYLNQCMRNDVYTCCAYGFLLSNQQTLCFHVLCQPVNDCSADWEHYGTECPPAAEESKYEETQETRIDDQEGWLEET